MEFYMKLPRNLKEKILFMFIVSLISVNIIGPIISMMEIGFTLENYVMTLRIFPFIWVAVIVSVIIAEKPAAFLKDQLLDRKDSFNAQIIVLTIFDVLIISFLMTIIGSWIGSRKLSWDPILNFGKIWPRNFGIALFVEALIAQPFARKILEIKHTTGKNN